MSRISARENLMKLVFEFVLAKNNFDEEVLSETPSLTEDDIGFIKTSFAEIQNNYENITSLIENNLINYKLERICKTDLAILIVAIYEIKYLNLDKKIAINEAVELAKKYSTDNSYKFVNGLLAKVAN